MHQGRGSKPDSEVKRGAATWCLSDCATLLRSFQNMENSPVFFGLHGRFRRLVFALHAGSQVHAKDQISRQKHHTWIIAGRELGEIMSSSQSAGCPRMQSKPVDRGRVWDGRRKVNQSQACLDGLTSPTLSSFFSRFFFFRFLFFPLVMMIPCKFCEWTRTRLSWNSRARPSYRWKYSWPSARQDKL